MSVLLVIFHLRVEKWYLLAGANIICAVLITGVVVKYESAEPRRKEGILKVLRYWYPVIMILFIFKENYLMVHPINPHDIDQALIQIDRIIFFGENPTQWIYKIANPVLTEIMEIIYVLYYILIVIFGLELYLRKRYEDMKYSIFILFTGFYLSYLLYMFLPAVGPRFHLHNFASIDSELPGLFLTKILRVILNFGESIPSDVTNPQDFVQRDAMPSAHAEIVILITYLSRKLGLNSFRYYLPYCILMIISTVYLRYHYVIDLIAGGVLALITMRLAKFVYKTETDD